MTLTKITKKRKAQTHSVDMVISLSIFIAIFLSIAGVWDHIRMTFGNNEVRDDLELLSRYAVDSLVLTSGNPQGWYNFTEINRTSVLGIGLASPYYGIISNKKLSAFISHNGSSYEEYKEIFGMKGPGYEFRINISYYDADFSYVGSDIVGYTGECSSVVRIDRVLKLDKEGFVALEFNGCIRI
ncbi:hypothetical protein JXB31_04110 [Candidatus Woesearchaeota archaeon]|nr:hypothetical protein [Candidatus Woesearchaeota archaeon]